MNLTRQGKATTGLMMKFPRIFLCIMGIMFEGGSFFMPLQNLHAQDREYSETISIQTDRDFYVAGEYLYFKCQLYQEERSRIESNFAYLILRSAENIVINNSTIRLIDNSAYGSIYLPDTLKTGIYQIICLTNWMKGFEVSGLPSKEILIANRFDHELNFLLNTSISVDQSDSSGREIDSSDERNKGLPFSFANIDSVFSARSKVRIDLILHDIANKFDISLSVSQKNSLNAFSYSLVDFVLTPAGEKYEPKLPDEIIFPPETNGIILTGRVTNKLTGKGRENIIVLLSTSDSLLNLQYTKTGKNGIFYFQLKNYYHDREVFLNIHPDFFADSLIMDVYKKSDVPEPFRVMNLSLNPGFIEHIHNSQNILKVQKALNQDYHHVIPFVSDHRHAPVLYSSPASVIQLDDYFPLADFLEITRELIEPLRIRQARDGYQINMVNRSTRSFFDKPPHFFLDGLPVGNLEEIMQLGTHDLKRIEIHNLPWVYGEIEFPGIVSAFSRDGRRGMQMTSKGVSYGVEAPLPPSKYLFQTDSSTGDGLKKGEPDLRQLLYWNPSIVLSAQNNIASIEFLTGDIKDEFIVKAEALAPDGTVIFLYKSIKVE